MEEKKNIYIGQRYVPKVMGQWNSTQDYEGLSIVIHQGDSYTSKKHVPAGIDIHNEEFWVITGNYNAQIADYQNRVSIVEDKIDEKADTSYVESEVSTLGTLINQKADTTYVEGEVSTLGTLINQKADTSYVQGEVSTLNTSINQKADTTYVDDELDKRATKTTTSITYHVATNGNNNNTGTSPNNAFRTIAKAVSMIPNIIADDHEVTISIGTGEWNEAVLLSNITVNGELIVEGATDDRDNHKVTRVECERITGVLTIRNLYATTETTVGFRFNRCAPYVYVTNVIAYGDPNGSERSGYHGLLADYGSNVLVTASDFSSRRYGMRVNYLSRIFSSNNTGTGNYRGLGARWGGILQTNGTQPTGTTPRTTDSGGLILGSRGFMFDKEREMSDFYLQENIRYEHDGEASKRIYNIVNINNANRPIESNQKLVITFSYTSFGPVSLDFKYGGEQENSQPQHIYGHWTGNISTILRGGQLSIISSNQMSDSDVQVRKIPNEQTIELTIIPANANAGRWGVDLTIQMMRSRASAPKLLNVEIQSV